MICILSGTVLVIPTTSAMKLVSVTPFVESSGWPIDIQLLKIDTDGRMIFRVTNIGNENINWSVVLVKFKGGGFSLTKTNASTYVYIVGISPNESQTLKTENPVARVWLLLHRPFLLGVYQLDLTFRQYSSSIRFKIIGNIWNPM